MAAITKQSLVAWPIFIVACGLYTLLFYQLQAEANSLQTTAHHQVEQSMGSYTQAVKLKGSNTPIVLAKTKPFRATSTWSYVSATAPLPSSYRALGLKEYSALPHAPEADVHLQPIAGTSLTKLFTAARKAGYPLALSSAYRSISDQQALYSTYLARYGQDYVDKYVATPKTSEHHTGLAVDISDETSSCLASADGCSLSPASSAWLADNAPRFGFILRYPENKQSVTGVAYEPWHFRYIGPAASSLTKSGLTLDEFVRKVNAS